MYMGSSGLSVTNKFKVESNGKFNFGNGAIVFDGSTLTFGNNVSITWNNLPSTVASTSQIPTDVNQLNDASGQKWSTSIGNNWIKTCSVECQNLKVSAANITGTLTVKKLTTDKGQYSVITIADGEIRSGNTSIHQDYNNLSIAASGCVIIERNASDQTAPGSGYGTSFVLEKSLIMDVGSNALYGGSLGFGERGASGSYYVSEHGNGHFDGLYSSSGSVGKSDKKAKNHIMELSDVDGLEDFFMRLKPSAYTMKQNDSQRVHFGLYAQDVSEAAYDTIGDVSLYQALRKEHGDSDDEYAGQPFDPTMPDEKLEWFINYDGFIAPLVAMVQKQNREIKELQSQLQQLEV